MAAQSLLGSSPGTINRPRVPFTLAASEQYTLKFDRRLASSHRGQLIRDRFELKCKNAGGRIAREAFVDTRCNVRVRV